MKGEKIWTSDGTLKCTLKHIYAMKLKLGPGQTANACIYM